MLHLLFLFFVLWIVIRIFTRPFRHSYRCHHHHHRRSGLFSILALVALDRIFFDRRY